MKIPKDFYDFEGNAFTHCKNCQIDLLNPAQAYTIEKAVKVYPEGLGEQVIFEHAICLSCSKQLSEEISKESKERLQNYFEEKYLERSINRPNQNPLDFKACLISGDRIDQGEFYQVYALCNGDNLNMHQSPPFGLSAQAIEDIQEELSTETKDFLSDFMGKHFGVPPEWEGQPSPLLL